MSAGAEELDPVLFLLLVINRTLHEWECLRDATPGGNEEDVEDCGG
jgi:hypothetical protein